LPVRNCICSEIHHKLLSAGQLVDAGNSITLVWIPGHTGIRGNERADEAAKAALISTVSTMKCPASDFIPEFCVRRHRLSTYGRQAFAVAGPTVWNSLPEDMRDPDVSENSYRQSLKTFLFSQY